MVASASLPEWVMLDRFVFRREDADPFPAEKTTLATSFTSQGSGFRVWFRLVKPPAVSRLCFTWPDGPDPEIGQPCVLVAAHRNLVLFSMTSIVWRDKEPFYPQDHFIYRADPSQHQPLLKLLPACTKPPKVSVCGVDGDGDNTICSLDVQTAEEENDSLTMRRFLDAENVGLLCRGEEEFAVAHFHMNRSIPNVFAADLCVLRSCESTSSDSKWEIMQRPIHCTEDDLLHLHYWSTGAVIPFKNYLCWVDYDRGILFCEVFEESPKISYLRLPLDNYHCFTRCCRTAKWYRSVCVTQGGDILKFIDVARDDGEDLGSLTPGHGFTITSYNLATTESGEMKWVKVGMITSDELWARNTPERLPHDILMFPLVSMDEPHVVHFVSTEWTGEVEKMSLISIDMRTKTVQSVFQYIKGDKDLCGEDADMVKRRSHLINMPFLPSQLPLFLNFTRYLCLSHLKYLFMPNVYHYIQEVVPFYRASSPSGKNQHTVLVPVANLGIGWLNLAFQVEVKF